MARKGKETEISVLFVICKQCVHSNNLNMQKFPIKQPKV